MKVNMERLGVVHKEPENILREKLSSAVPRVELTRDQLVGTIQLGVAGVFLGAHFIAWAIGLGR